MRCLPGRLHSHSLGIRREDFEYFIELPEFTTKRAKQTLDFAYVAQVSFDVSVRISLYLDRSGGSANQRRCRAVAKFVMQRFESPREFWYPFRRHALINQSRFPLIESTWFNVCALRPVGRFVREFASPPEGPIPTPLHRPKSIHVRPQKSRQGPHLHVIRVVMED